MTGFKQLCYVVIRHERGITETWVLGPDWLYPPYDLGAEVYNTPDGGGSQCLQDLLRALYRTPAPGTIPGRLSPTTVSHTHLASKLSHLALPLAMSSSIGCVSLISFNLLFSLLPSPPPWSKSCAADQPLTSPSSS